MRALLRSQFPQWADLPLERVTSSGTDNTIYRLGPELVVRLPLIDWAVNQVELEHTWLPRLAPLVAPVQLHEPVAMGEPGEGYPWRWSVYRWIEGENPGPDSEVDPLELASFVSGVRSVEDAPRSWRGSPLVDEPQIRAAIDRLADEYDTRALTAIYEDGLAAPRWRAPFVTVHGDLTDGNLVMRDGRLHAVIDWSCFGLADPAVEAAAAWELFNGVEERSVFLEAIEADADTRRRARAWAVKAVYGIGYYERTNPGIVVRARRRLRNLLAEAELGG